LSGLQLSSEQFSDPFAPSNVVSQVVAQAGVVLKNAWNLLLSTKTILDAAESVEQTQDMKTSKSLIIDTVHARRSSLVGENKPKSPFESSSRRGSMGPVPLPTRSSTDNSPSNTSAQPIKSSLGVASETALSDTSETNVYRSSLLPGQKLMKFFGEDVSKSAIGKNELTDTGYAPYMISDFAEDDILFHSDTSLRIKAGTKKALVEYLTSHVYPGLLGLQCCMVMI
jgi:hypothetical protein